MRDLLSEYGVSVISVLVGISVVGVLWYIIDLLEILNLANITALV